MHKPMRSCTWLTRNCGAICTVMVDVPPENVPQTCHQDMTPSHFLSKSWRNLYHPIISRPISPFFSGVEDPENHLKAFRAQMIIFVDSDALRCKMFMGVFTGTNLQWFSGILDGHITSFPQFSRMLKEQFSTNKVNPHNCMIFFMSNRGKGSHSKNT